jgi:hypothetical protein
MKWIYRKFQAVWTVGYNDSESEKLSKIFLSNYTTFTDAVEATMNQYKVSKKFHEKKTYSSETMSKKTILCLSFFFRLAKFINVTSIKRNPMI